MGISLEKLTHGKRIGLIRGNKTQAEFGKLLTQTCIFKTCPREGWG